MKHLERPQTTSSLDLTLSTDRPETFSAGVSVVNYIGRCDPVPYDAGSEDSTESDHWFRFPVCEQPHGTRAYFDMCVPSDSEVFTLSETDAYRLFCHIVVQLLPAGAFSEAVESLTQMFEFYREPPLALPAQAAPASVQAKVSGSYTAPVYPITED